MEGCGLSSKEYKTVLKDVIKCEIQALLDRLSEVGEESVVLTVSLDCLSCGHLGSRKGKGFVEASRLEEVQQKFLGYCSDDAVTDGEKQTCHSSKPVTTAEQNETSTHVRKSGRVRRRKRQYTVKTYTDEDDTAGCMYVEPTDRDGLENLENVNDSNVLANQDQDSEPCDLSTKDQSLFSQFCTMLTGEDLSGDKGEENVLEGNSDRKNAESYNTGRLNGEEASESLRISTESKEDKAMYIENSDGVFQSETPKKIESDAVINTSPGLNNVSPTFRNALCLMPNPNRSLSTVRNDSVARRLETRHDSTKFEVLEPSMVQVKIEEEEPVQYSPSPVPTPTAPTNDTFINFQRPICSLSSVQFEQLIGNPMPYFGPLSGNMLDLNLQSTGITRNSGADRLKTRKRKPRKESKLKIKAGFTKIFSPQVTSSTQKKPPLFSYKDAGTICSECGQEFNKPESMIRHKIRKHLPRAFVCEVCQKGFSFKSELDKHFRIHSGEKPYACSYCPKQFADGGNRMKHEMRCRRKLNQTF